MVGGVTRLLGNELSMMTYRLISTLIGAAVLTWALWLMRRAGGRRAAMALIALNPMTIFIVASTNPASTELAGTLLLWAYVAVLLTRDRVAGRRQLLMASSIAAGVVLIRPVALPWVAIALGAYLLLERRPFAADRSATARLLAVSSIPLVAAVAVSSAWSRYAGVGLTDDKFVVDRLDGRNLPFRTRSHQRTVPASLRQARLARHGAPHTDVCAVDRVPRADRIARRVLQRSTDQVHAGRNRCDLGVLPGVLRRARQDPTRVAGALQLAAARWRRGVRAVERPVHAMAVAGRDDRPVLCRIVGRHRGRRASTRPCADTWSEAPAACSSAAAGIHRSTPGCCSS